MLADFSPILFFKIQSMIFIQFSLPLFSSPFLAKIDWEKAPTPPSLSLGYLQQPFFTETDDEQEGEKAEEKSF